MDEVEELTEKLQFTLLENALHSINTALEFLAEHPDRLKIVVMLLGQGCELVLKARIEQEHWSLVFDDPRGASRERFEKGDFRSVGFDQCLKRLEQICDIEFNQKHCKELKRLRDMRNRIEHFSVAIRIDVVEATAYNVLSFLLDFVRCSFSSLSLGEKDLQAKIRERVGRLAALVESRWHEIGPRIEQARANGQSVLECSTCSQQAAVVVGDGEVVCEFCHEEVAAAAMAQAVTSASYASMRPKDSLSADLGPWSCPHCERFTLIAESPGYLCLSCGTGWSDLDHCDSCGAPFDDGDEATTCGNCFAARMGT